MEPIGDPQDVAEREGPTFLASGGELGRLIAGYDWAATSLGPTEVWPAHLRTTVGLLLRSPVPIVTLWGEDGIMIYNDAYSVFAGGRHPRLLGSKVREGWPEVADFNDNVMKVGLAGGTLAYRDQELTLHRHGRPEQVWMNLDYSPIPGEDGQPAGVIAIVVETTGKVRAEAELRVTAGALAELNAELEQRVEERTRERDRMWRLSTDVMLVADFNARIEAVNPAWTALLGWGEGELLGQDFLALIHPDDLAATLREVGNLSSGRTTLRFENRYRQKDGTYRWLSWTAVPDERFIHAVGRDIQAEKEAAEALRRAEEALRQSQKMEAVGQLTGGIAHDFNNLLTGITGSLELLRSRLAQGRLTDLDRYITTAHGAAGRAAALTHRLLAFARRQTLDPKPTNVNRLISGMEELIRRTVGPEITVEVVGSAGLWTVLVDPNQLESALLNLCINARDAMPDGGRITIETANKWLDDRAGHERDLPPGQYLSLCVTDTGTGMTPEVIGRAFDPFFTTKPIGQGTGLGLSMIYGFVRQSGGQVRIYSELGQGTTMCLYLPRHHGAEELADHAAALASAPRAERGETVLVVDDEPTVRMLVTEVLEDLGYTAIEAADGTAGLRVLRSDARIDLLVTDVGLPGGMNGRQLADAARELRPGLRILFITGYAENATVGHGLLEPGMHVLTKPFAMEALTTRIRDLIEDGA
ncbi:hybrid sensor histidine kinase/response regulator [Roseomonas populi]|uniref:histidine kinase n=1 Tax=Roseomonas populi TaxID=3121582 RepID=A0ABT1X5A7_9PROT|nr:PAS domain-containing sensor histidine kinase [Roseomonas pecuniae]MCR0983295.1 PAS domain S-box protein [Roseomonas pecuniae]